MKVLKFTLIADGSSDKTLLRIIKWSLDNLYPKLPNEGYYADFRTLPDPPKGLENKVAKAIIYYPFNILFIHRDAETISPKIINKRIEEIRAKLQEKDFERTICIVPIKMMETWLLFDLEAIKKAGYLAEIIRKEDPSNGNDKQDMQNGEILVVEKKNVENTEPFKLKLETSVLMDGEFSQKDSGPSFNGKITQTKKGEFQVPKDNKDADEFVEKLMSSSKIRQLFNIFSDSNSSTDNSFVKIDTVNNEPDKKSADFVKEKEPQLKQGGQENAIFSISGMHCASCAGIIEKSLKKVPGVKEANVNFASEKARVLYDKSITTIDKLSEAVKKSKPATDPVQTSDSRDWSVAPDLGKNRVRRPPVRDSGRCL